MAEAITWRSMAAPDFRTSAYMMNVGNETINKGITSLADLAKGYVDEQKGIMSSDAIASLSGAKTDEERDNLFATLSDQLRASGIDQKELITANQAQHESFNSDATLKSNLAMNDSTMAGNAIEQKGAGILNNMNQGKFDYQVTEQQQQTDQAAMDILTGRSNIDTNAAQVDIARSKAASDALSARVSDALHKAQAGQIGKENKKEDLERNAAAQYAAILDDPSVLTKDPATGEVVIDQSKAYDLGRARGMNPLDITLGRNAYNANTERDRTDAATLAATTKADKYAFSEHEQSLKDFAKNKADAKVAQKAGVDAGIHWYSSDSYKASANAAVDAANAAQVVGPGGKIIRLDPSEISGLLSDSSKTLIYGDNSGGELDTVKFLNAVKSAMATKTNDAIAAEQKLKQGAKQNTGGASGRY